MQLTLSQAAELFGRHRSTIHRHINAGRLSCSFRGDGSRVLDLSELIRCYGEPARMPAHLQPDATPPDNDVQQAMLQALQAMHAELVALREEMAELRRLPAPEPPQEPQKGDDPHGLRAIVKGMKEGEGKP